MTGNDLEDITVSLRIKKYCYEKGTKTVSNPFNLDSGEKLLPSVPHIFLPKALVCHRPHALLFRIGHAAPLHAASVAEKHMFRVHSHAGARMAPRLEPVCTVKKKN